MTVSLGDHNVNNTHADAKNVFRKLKRVVRQDRTKSSKKLSGRTGLKSSNDLSGRTGVTGLIKSCNELSGRPGLKILRNYQTGQD